MSPKNRESKAMRCSHHELVIEDLQDDWWAEADMAGFDAPGSAYKVDKNAFSNRHVFIVPIEKIEPVYRNLSNGVFNDNSETGQSARERVVSILRGLREGTAMKPVEVVRLVASDPYRYKPFDGVHRFYCSVAAGFTHIPAVEAILIDYP